tara:strand:- start:77935 stop:78144 length:210 start_codon:yes stop_codon:yes gene_type:complete
MVKSRLVPFSNPVSQSKQKRTAGFLLRFFFYPQKVKRVQQDFVFFRAFRGRKKIKMLRVNPELPGTGPA